MARQEIIDHDRICELLSPFLDGQVAPEERAAVEGHLATCKECAQELRDLRWTVELLHQVPVARVPRSFAVPAAQPAPRRGFLAWLSGDLAYSFLRGATALATILLVMITSVDVLGVGLGGQLAPVPAAAPMPVAQEAVMEKPAEVAEEVVVEKVVEVERKMLATAEVATEVPPAKALPEMAPAAQPSAPVEEGARALAVPFAATPYPAPTPAAVDLGAVAEASPPAVAATEEVPPTVADAEAVRQALATPTAPAVVPPAPGVAEAVPVAAPLAGPGLLRQVEIGLFAASVILIAATLVVRRQRAH